MSLVDLTSAPLTAEHQALLQRAAAGAAGHKAWRLRMHREARDLLVLASRAPRLSIVHLEMAGDLRAVVHLLMPVPCRIGDGDLIVAHETLLGLNYPEESLLRSLPGAAFVQVLRPLSVFLPNVKPGPQVVCLGATIPAGTKLTELLLMAYRALVLQEHNFDVRDPAGVFRADAAEWWQRNTDRVPLTEAPFLAAPDLPGKETR